MTNLRHVGIYVSDLNKMTSFYKSTFELHTICENVVQKDELIAELVGENDSAVKITKLITDRGKETGIGDMLELVEVLGQNEKQDSHGVFDKVCKSGCAHICLGVNDIMKVLGRLESNDGTVQSNIKSFPNGNVCCFCTDPEGNWLELIASN